MSAALRTAVLFVRTGLAILLNVTALVVPCLAAEPVVSVWYRGTPAGTPRLDDLAAIKAAGFGAITWPSGDPKRIPDVSRLVEKVGLALVLQPDGPAMPPPEGRINIRVASVRPDAIPATVWRAVARGVRTISFDPEAQDGTGFEDTSGRRREWVAFAVAAARHLRANAELIGQLVPAAAPRFLSQKPGLLDVVLLEGARAWVIVATNAASERAGAEVALPRGVPYAIWVSLVDASTIAMLDRSDGARWRFQMDAGAAAVYVIDKVSPASSPTR